MDNQRKCQLDYYGEIAVTMHVSLIITNSLHIPKEFRVSCPIFKMLLSLHKMCEEGVGFLDIWGYFVGEEDMYVRDGLRLSGKSAAVFSENLLRSMDNGTGCNYLNYILRGIHREAKYWRHI